MLVNIVFYLLSPTAGFCVELILLDGQKWSTGGAIGSTPAIDFLAVTMTRCIPTKPLSPGYYEFKISPASIVLKREVSEEGLYYRHEVKGLSGAFSLTYGLSHHFGLNFTTGYAKGYDGEAKKTISDYSAGTAFTGNRSNDQGYLFAANLIYDPFSDPEGFRLPIIIGISYTQASGKYEIPFIFVKNCNSCNSPPNRIGHKGKEKEVYDIGGTPTFLSISPQFNTGPVRWVPFIFMVGGPGTSSKVEVTQSDLTTGESRVSQVDVGGGGIGGLGLEIIYRPWNLSYTYIPPSLGNLSGGFHDTIESHALTWSKNW